MRFLSFLVSFLQFGSRIPAVARMAGLLITMFAPHAQAFEGTAPPISSSIPVPGLTCTAYIQFLEYDFDASSGGFAYVALIKTGGGIPATYAGATLFSGGSVFPSSGTALSEADTKAKCGMHAISNLSQAGAAGAFLAEDYIGFSFDAQRNAGDAVMRYTYALSGATNTQLIQSAILVNSAPTADAGTNFSANVGAQITLNATGTTDAQDASALTYTWFDGTTQVGTGRTLQFTPTGTTDGSQKTYRVEVTDGPFTDDDTVTVTFAGLPKIQILGDGAVMPHNQNAGAILDHRFYSRQIGSEQTKTFVIKNIGTKDLTLGTITNTNTAMFSATQPAALTLAPGGTTTFTAKFTATVNGYRDGVVSIPSNSTIKNPFKLRLRGRGNNTTPSVSIAGDTEIQDGQTLTLTANATDINSPPQTLTYLWSQTSGPSAVTIGDATSAQASFPIPALTGGATSATYTFRVVVNDGLADTLRISEITVRSAAKLEVRQASSGTVIAHGDSTPSTADGTDLGSYRLGSGDSFPVSKLSLQNVGGLNLATTNVTITGSDAAHFTIDGTNNGVNAAIASASGDDLWINFAPTTVGEKTATVSITSNDANTSPYTFTIKGTATGEPELQVKRSGTNIFIAHGDTSPATADGTDYGTVTLGQTGGNLKLKLRNNGQVNLATSAVTITGSDAAHFPISSTYDGLDSAILPNQGTDLWIRFVPTTVGQKTATVSITSNDPNTNPYTFTIQGTAIGPEISVTSSIGGAVADGGADTQNNQTADVAKTVTYTVTNSGSGVLNLQATPTATNLVNVGTPVISAPASSTVASGGGTTTFTVAYTPAALGAFSFDLDILSDDANESPYDVSIIGTAVAGAASNLAATSGGGQSKQILTSFDTPLLATVTDAGGNPVSGVTVNFAAPGSGASATLSTASAVTNTSGQAQVTATANGTVGAYNVTASASGLTDVTFGLTNIDNEAPVITGTGNLTGTTSAGGTVTLAATVTDNSGETIAPVFTTSSGVVTSASVFPLGDTLVTVNASDSQGNAATSVTFTVTITDDEVPSVTLGALTATGSGTYTSAITLSEAAGNGTAFALADLMLSNATATLSGSGTSFTATLTPSADGLVKLSVAAGAFQDAAGNDATAGAEVSVTFDGTAPSVTLGALTATGSGTYTSAITLSEAAGNGTAFALADLMLSNATATLSGSGTSFTATLTPSADGLVKLSVAAGAFQDAAGNDATAGAEVSVTFDGTAPSVTLGALTATGSGTYTSAITLSEAAGNGTAFALADLMLSNATATLSGSGTSFTATLTPSADGLVKLSVAAGAFQDAAGNDATAGAEVSVTFDGTAPSVTLGALTATGSGTYTSAITLSEAAGNGTAFALADLMLSNATATLSGSGTSFTATLTPSADGLVKLSVAAGAFQDAAGNDATAGAEVSVTFDGTAPSVTLGALTATGSGTYTSAITLSEAAGNGTAFALADLMLSNATATLSGSGTSFTATLTPSADGLVKLSVAAGAFQDAAGNDATAGAEVSVTFDGTAPGVVISGVPESFTGISSFTVTITFSESVSGFASQDITVINGAIASLSGSGSAYQVLVNANGAGDVSISIPANQAHDTAGNGNTASSVVTSENKTVEETQKQIAQFMGSRANSLASNQPKLTCFLAGGCGGGTFDANAIRGRLSFSFVSNPDRSVWYRLKGSRTHNGSSQDDYLFGALGTHRQFTDNFLLGVMLQFDHQSSQSGTGTIEGTGWLAGPYVVGKAANQPLYYEGRLMWGQTANKISPFGTYEDEFTTERLLLQGRVEGRLEYGDLTLKPNFSGSYATDTQQAYTDGLGNIVPEQGIEIGQVSLGLDFNKSVTLDDQIWNFDGGIAGIYSSTSGRGAAASVIAPHDGARGRLHLNASHKFRNGGSITLGAAYDGIGAKDYESVGLEFGYKLEF